MLEYTIIPYTPQHAATMHASRFSSIIPTLDFHRRGIVSRASPRSTVPTLDFHRRGIVSRASPRRGGISGVTSAHLNVHRPSGGDDAMDRVQISDPDPFSAKASDYMSTPAAFVTPELELGDPIVKKLLRSYSGVPVLDKSRHVIGVLSHKDISAVEVLEKSKVKDVMSKPAHVVTSGANLAQVWAEMLQWKVWRLPVVDPVSKQLVGVLCRSDILTPILNTAEDIRTHGEEVEREEHMGMLKDEKDEEDALADDEGSAEFFSADADADVVDDADDDNGEPYSRTP